ncbi:MAG: methionine gamma-lyase family protein [Oscillospiraceae bacterium]|nr:methionine gamma-lyase family protein [Oscillospiraceae bacterium]
MESLGSVSNIRGFLDEAEAACAGLFRERERIESICFRRVMDSFRASCVSSADFAGSTGYGYNDRGRENLERVFAAALECEDALVGPRITSGTHAIALALFGLLRPGDTLLAATGKPYDTLDGVIGLDDTPGSLAQTGVSYRQVDLLPGGEPDLDAITRAITPATRVIHIQRSRGYARRPTLSPETIGSIAGAVKRVKPDAVVFVDNCYGEFTREHEPSFYGADLLAGSLIKNPGGGIAPTGGYVAGARGLVERAAARLTCPGIGREIGSYEAGYRLFYQGLFIAPHAVCQAVQGGILAAYAFESLGFETSPRWNEPRGDVVQSVRLGEADLVRRFCETVQRASPVDSFAAPIPDDMPGYADPVIMACGAFVGGASLELSADAPMRPPYDVFIQGGLARAHARLMLELWLENKQLARLHTV